MGKERRRLNWRGSSSYKRWQTRVFKRDNFRCVKCGTQENLLTDHIKSGDVYPSFRFLASNGRTLCQECHGKYGMRAYKLRLVEEKSIVLEDVSIPKDKNIELSCLLVAGKIRDLAGLSGLSISDFLDTRELTLRFENGKIYLWINETDSPIEKEIQLTEEEGRRVTTQ